MRRRLSSGREARADARAGAVLAADVGYLSRVPFLLSPYLRRRPGVLRARFPEAIYVT